MGDWNKLTDNMIFLGIFSGTILAYFINQDCNQKQETRNRNEHAMASESTAYDSAQRVFKGENDIDTSKFLRYAGYSGPITGNTRVEIFSPARVRDFDSKPLYEQRVTYRLGETVYVTVRDAQKAIDRLCEEKAAKGEDCGL